MYRRKGLPHQLEITLRLQPAASSVFSPLMRNQPSIRHDVRHGRSIGQSRFIRTSFRIAIHILRPQSMNHKTKMLTPALRTLPMRVAKFRSPRKRQKVVIKLPRRTPLPSMSTATRGLSLKLRQQATAERQDDPNSFHIHKRLQTRRHSKQPAQSSSRAPRHLPGCYPERSEGSWFLPKAAKLFDNDPNRQNQQSNPPDHTLSHLETCYNILRQTPINHLQMQPLSPNFATINRPRSAPQTKERKARSQKLAARS
jgi:hypothetical protein